MSARQEYEGYNFTEKEFIQFMEKKQTPELCMKIVSFQPQLLRHVVDQTPELCLMAVKRYGPTIQYVRDQTPEICLAAMHRHGYSLEYVKEQTPEICMVAVKHCPNALRFVKEQTLEICMAAVNIDGFALEYVRQQTPEICLAAVKKVGAALFSVKEQTPEICLEAVKDYGMNLRYVQIQTPEICLAAVQKDGPALQYVKEQTAEICLAAVKENKNALRFVRIDFLHLFGDISQKLKVPDYRKNRMGVQWFYSDAYIAAVVQVPKETLNLQYANKIRKILKPPSTHIKLYTVCTYTHDRIEDASVQERDSMINSIIGFRCNYMTPEDTADMTTTLTNYIKSEEFKALGINVSSPIILSGIEVNYDDYGYDNNE